MGSNNKKLTYQFVKEHIESFGYKLNSKDYIDSKTKLDIVCGKGHEFSVSWSNFKKGSRCPECAGVKKKNISYIKEYVSKFGYTLLSTKYINAKTNLVMICDRGHEFYIRWDNFKTGSRCNVCANNQRKTIDEIKHRTESLGYKLISNKYKNNSVPLKFQCPEGHFFTMSWGNFNEGRRCTVCEGSHGERRICEYLSRKKINYKKEHSLKDLISELGNPLKFDVAIFKNNDNFVCLIEYQGEQHYRPVEYFGGEKEFIRRQHNDNKKKEYCIQNSIPLLIIPYWEFDNIENILQKYLTLEIAS